MKHVEVLRAMLDDAAIEPPWKPEEVAAITAALASLSAPQPPAEAQAQGGGEVELRHMVAKLAAHVRPTCGELWAEAERLLNRTAPPSAPVGVWDLPGKWRAEAEDAEPGVEKSYLSDYWLAHLHVAEELEEALAQQPAAVDESFVERFCGRWFQLTGRSLDRPSVRACLTEALAAQHGGRSDD